MGADYLRPVPEKGAGRRWCGWSQLLPEYEACRRMAHEQGLPLIEVYRLVPRE